jgi:transposase
LINHEGKRIVDLLEDRETAYIRVWLETHPEIEMITRDRGKNYIDGISLGALKAIQRADRFHLLRALFPGDLTGIRMRPPWRSS